MRVVNNEKIRTLEISKTCFIKFRVLSFLEYQRLILKYSSDPDDVSGFLDLYREIIMHEDGICDWGGFVDDDTGEELAFDREKLLWINDMSVLQKIASHVCGHDLLTGKPLYGTKKKSGGKKNSKSSKK